LTTEATSGALATSAAAWLTASAYFGVGQLPAGHVQYDRAGPVGLIGKGLAQRVGRMLAVRSRQRQVVVGVVAEAVRHPDQHHRHHKPDGKDREAMPSRYLPMAAASWKRERIPSF
jgi:hypothetical protein